jgi:ligand-binding sensor domain-containing protein
MLKNKLFFLLSFYFCLFSSKNMLSQNPQWINYTNGDEIYALADDGDYLWVGTRVGLVKIDKISQETSFYDKWSSGLSNNQIDQLTVDKSGNLWMVTYKGLEVFDGTSWIAYDTTNSGLPDCWISCIAVDELNNVWIGMGYERWSYDNTNPGGLVKYDGSNWTRYTTRNSDIPSDNINCIAIKGGDTIWVGTTKEMAKFDGSNWTVNDDSAFYDIDGIAVDGFGNIWIANNRDLSKYDSKFEHGTCWADHIFQYRFGSFQIDAFGYLWFSDGPDLIKTDGPYWYRMSDIPMKGNYGWINCFLIDETSIWLSASHDWDEPDGLLKYDQSRKWMKINTSNSQLPGGVDRIEIDKTGTIWLSCGGSLINIDDEEWTVYDTTNSELSCTYISCIEIDELNQKWIGTSEGLTLFDGMNWTNYEIWNTELPYNSLAANCIAIDDHGIKWIGTSGGLMKFDGYNWEMLNKYNSDLPCNIITFITIDDADNKWIVTGSDCHDRAGLVKYNGETWELFNTENSGLPHNFISCIAIDSMDNKWIGTNENGLVKYDDIQWTLFDESNSQLPSDNINCIRIDNNNVKWIGTQKGLAKYIDETWTIYTEENSGLVNNSVSSIAFDTTFNIWIGAVYGMSVLNENGVSSNEELFSNNIMVPEKYLLFQNYPNPFNPTTTIEFQLPQAGQVELSIYNMLGQEITTLVSENLKAGEYQYTWDAGSLASGVYLYRLRASEYFKSKKMILIR